MFCEDHARIIYNLLDMKFLFSKILYQYAPLKWDQTLRSQSEAQKTYGEGPTNMNDIEG